MLFLPLFCCSFCIAHGFLKKADITYDFLTSLSPLESWNTTYRMDDPITSDLSQLFGQKCDTQQCYIAVFNRNKTSYFQILIGVQNNCLTAPNCLTFDKTEYEGYSLFYSKDSRGVGTCSNAAVSSQTPKQCDDDWSEFLRPNGKKWCFQIFPQSTPTNKFTFDQAQAECVKLNANLNGIETDEEYSKFEALANKTVKIDSTEVTDKHIFLGARRNVTCESPNRGASLICANSNKMTWLNNVSRIEESMTPSNGKTEEWYDGSGDCLAFSQKWNRLDDMVCNANLYYYACGKYAT